jgi:MYXO-CTERM domain-containing protein
VFNTWLGNTLAFIWDNQPIGSGMNDGLSFLNFAPLNTPQFQLGNILLPVDTFNGTALPASAPAGTYVAQLGSTGQLDMWLSVAGFSLVSAVPEPLPIQMAPLGLLALAAAVRRRRA